MSELTPDQHEALELLADHDGEIATMPFLLAVGGDVAAYLVKNGYVRKTRSKYTITESGRLALTPIRKEIMGGGGE
jgi:hypothetical protein